MSSTRGIRPGFYPFWFWNDRLDDEEIRRQVAEMAAQGMRGFFIHPRQGLGQPYLSEAFFDKVGVAIEAARARGLDVHLYDEFPYPSGAAGGQVILGNPRYHATALTQKTWDLDPGPVRLELPEGRVLEARAFPLRRGAPAWNEGTDLSAQVGTLLSRNTYIEARSLSAYSLKRYWAGCPRPVLETTIERVPHRLFVSVQSEVRRHKYWGGYVDVFNKEAIRHFLTLTHERYHARFGKDFGRLIRSIFVDETAAGWSDLLPEAFRKEYGYDLRERLHVLQAPDHPDHARVQADLFRLKYRLFCDAFEAPYSRWCRRHRIAYSGEKAAMRLAQMRYMDLPGCDPGHTKAGALTECFHSLGWSATLQDLKLITEGLLLCGIRYLVPHGAFYTTHGLRKHDAPPSVFWQMPWWPFFGRLAERVERIHRAFKKTWIDAQVLLADPGSGVPTEEDRAAYERLHHGLMARHVEYLVADTDILRSGEIGDGRVRIRDITARAVILPPMRVVEPEMAEWLNRFERAGGMVVRCASDADVDAACRAAEAAVGPSLRLDCRGGDGGRLWMVKRRSAKRTLWFLVNTGVETLDLTLAPDAGLREVTLGPAASSLVRESNGRYRRRVTPFESVLLEAGEARAVKRDPPRIPVTVGGPARVRCLNRNLLRLYDWRMSVLNYDGSVGEAAVVPAVPLANQLAHSRARIAPDIRIIPSGETILSIPPLRVRYEYEFQNACAGTVELVMEPETIVGDWSVTVNDAAPVRAGDFAPTDAHVRGSLGADITPLLRRGTNRLLVEVATDRPDGGLLNALYLAGDFGVRLAPPMLVDRPDSGGFEEYEDNLLPCYAGSIEYETEFDAPAPPRKGDVVLEFSFEVPFEEAAEVSVNGSPFQPLLWNPRALRLPAASLQPGRNRLTTRVHTTLIRSFEGKWFDILAHRYRNAGEKGDVTCKP